MGNLLTIVLVSISDVSAPSYSGPVYQKIMQVLFGAGIENLTIWSFVGCSVITTSFGVLAYDTYKKGLDVA